MVSRPYDFLAKQTQNVPIAAVASEYRIMNGCAEKLSRVVIMPLGLRLTTR